MGVDATIWFNTSMSVEEIQRELALEPYLQVSEVGELLSKRGETHELDNPWRLYDTGYERGYWPGICEVLMQLLAHPLVKVVWYGGDGNPWECDIDRVLELSKHYMTVGHEPYRRSVEEE